MRATFPKGEREKWEGYLRQKYAAEGKSAREVAEELKRERGMNISPYTVWEWLVRFGIPTRTPAETTRLVWLRRVAGAGGWLREKYVVEKKTPRQISEEMEKELGVSLAPSSIYHSWLPAAGVPLRSRSEATSLAKMRYPKTPFSGEPLEKAYMVGLRIGDVSAYRDALQVAVHTSSTHPAWSPLFGEVWGRYGRVTRFPIYHHRWRVYMWRFLALLDSSFDFLLEDYKQIPDDILADGNAFFSCLAGITDCEGTLGIYPTPHGGVVFVYKLANSNLRLLQQIRCMLDRYGVRAHVRMFCGRGTLSGGVLNIRRTRDCYELRFSLRLSIFWLTKKLLPLSKHPEKKAWMKLIVETLKNSAGFGDGRLSGITPILWSSVEPLVSALHNDIKAGTLMSAAEAEEEYIRKHRKARQSRKAIYGAPEQQKMEAW